MKQTRQCPKCSGKRILRIAHIEDKAPGAGGGVLAVRSRVMDGEDGLGEWVNVGVFEALVCAACGHAELYVKSPESIPVDGKVVSWLEASDRGPYR
jgi:predicted nucleic-acid-binding Zn-ribbon protein